MVLQSVWLGLAGLSMILSAISFRMRRLQGRRTSQGSTNRSFNDTARLKLYDTAKADSGPYFLVSRLWGGEP